MTCIRPQMILERLHIKYTKLSLALEKLLKIIGIDINEIHNI